MLRANPNADNSAQMGMKITHSRHSRENGNPESFKKEPAYRQAGWIPGQARNDRLKDILRAGRTRQSGKRS